MDTLELTAKNDITIRIDAMNLKNDFAISRPIVVIVCMIWLLRIIGALTASKFMGFSRRWRSRPQHHNRTHAVQQQPRHKPFWCDVALGGKA
jgi:hypothetical protein